jgi:hypothetical protein
MSLFGKVVPVDSQEDDKTDPSSPSIAEVKERIFGSRRKSSKRKASEADDTFSEKELADLFAGENWEEISSLYFDARYATTGYDGFLLTNPQKKTLGLTLGKSMKMLLKIDPGYIAGVVFLTTFGGLIAQKEIVYSKLLKEQKGRTDDGKNTS